MRYKTIQHHSNTRVLALDPHPRSFGYVVMESPGKLLDWGVRRSYRKTTNHPEVLAGKRLGLLLKTWKPDLVLTRVGERREKGVQALFRQIRQEVDRRAFVPSKRSRATHAGEGKYQRAVAMTARFPEIGWKLPSKRKPWESEHYSTSIFEALEVAVIYAG